MGFDRENAEKILLSKAAEIAAKGKRGVLVIVQSDHGKMIKFATPALKMKVEDADVIGSSWQKCLNEDSENLAKNITQFGVDTKNGKKKTYEDILSTLPLPLLEAPVHVINMNEGKT